MSISHSHSFLYYVRIICKYAAVNVLNASWITGQSLSVLSGNLRVNAARATPSYGILIGQAGRTLFSHRWKSNNESANDAWSTFHSRDLENPFSWNKRWEFRHPFWFMPAGFSWSPCPDWVRNDRDRPMCRQISAEILHRREYSTDHGNFCVACVASRMFRDRVSSPTKGSIVSFIK